MPKRNFIKRSKDILGGAAVFADTRVPVQTLIDYLEGGHTLEEFLDDFPTVDHSQVIGVLEQLKQILLVQPA